MQEFKASSWQYNIFRNIETILKSEFDETWVDVDRKQALLQAMHRVLGDEGGEVGEGGECGEEEHSADHRDREQVLVPDKDLSAEMQQVDLNLTPSFN